MTTIETEINGKPFKITLEDGASVEISDGEIKVKAGPKTVYQTINIPASQPYVIPQPYVPPIVYPYHSFPQVTWSNDTNISGAWQLPQ